MNKRTVRILGLVVAAWAAGVLAAEPAAAPKPSPLLDDLNVLSKALTTPVKLLRGDLPQFTVTITGTYKSDAESMTGQVTLVRADAERFGLTVRVGDLWAELLRDTHETRLVIPSKNTALVGKGDSYPASPLVLERLIANLIALQPKANAYVGLVRAADPGALALILQHFGQLERVPPKPGEKAPPIFVVKRLKEDRLTIQTTPDGLSIGTITWKGPRREVSFTIQITEEAALPKAATDGLKIVSVDRAELELALGRGLVRAVDVLHYNSEGGKPDDEVRKVDIARLVIKKGQRVAILSGKPYRIGFQHGKLLAREARRLCDTVLYCVGTAYSIEKQRWFLDDIRKVFERTRPHIPAEYLEEMRGLADGSGIPLESIQLANVFPALFHCSGFVLLPKATQTDKLYHGRVLDYMTQVGLQREAVLFAVSKHGRIPFANVGYAGFIGSVTGMNTRQVCIGEMGGGGAGKYDGTPMPILLRMALERAGSLQDAMRIFKEAKRTCEYYYCISDAKIPDAVGVYATPEKIEFIKPGEAHPLLPTPVEHCLLLSSGDRYKALVAKVKAGLGRFNAIEARKLMTRPVVMKSNLHNVLFVPKQMHIYVAHARGSKPAYRQHYIKYDLKKLLAPPTKTRPFPKAHGSGRAIW